MLVFFNVQKMLLVLFLGLICFSTVVDAQIWTETGALECPRQSHTATQLSNGNVLVAAGQSSPSPSSYLNSAEVYNATTGNWTGTGSLTYGRCFHTATLLNNGNVLVAGGTGGTVGTGVSSPLNSVELYNATTGVWTLTGSLTSTRELATATLLPNGNVLVTGGTTNVVVGLNSAELYNPTTGVWNETGNLIYARYQHTATLLSNGNVLVAGGTNGGALNSSAELYNATTGVWTVTGNLTYGRYVHTAILLSNGNVLVAGGCNGQCENTPNILNSAELYNAATGGWTVTGSLTYARYDHTATLLSNGNVLVAAGRNGIGISQVYLNSAELYNATTGVWNVTGSLNFARVLATATLLLDGNVLVAGGLINIAELYNPSIVSTPTPTTTPTPTLTPTSTATATATCTATATPTTTATPTPIADLPPITSFSTPFDANFPAYTLNGNAQLANDFIQLTDPSVGETGSTYLISPVDISKPFSVFYQVQIQCTAGSLNTTSCADGFAFVLQPTSTALLGNVGGSVAIEGASKPYWAIAAFTYTTMTLSLVTFPFSQSNYGSVTLAPLSFSGDTIYINVWLDYDPTGYVDVSYSSAFAVIRYSAQSSSTVPSEPSAATGVISSASIQQVLNSTEAFIGFSAATGGDAEYHTVELWTFQGSYCTPDLHPGCSSFALNSCYCQVCSTNYVSNGYGGCYITSFSTPVTSSSFPLYSLNGNAVLLSNNLVQLTSETDSQASSVYIKAGINVTNSFSMFVQVAITCSSSLTAATNYCADGFAINFQPTNPFLVGGSGSSVGILDQSSAFYSVGLETYGQNALSLYVHTAGSSPGGSPAPMQQAPLGLANANTATINLWIDYNASLSSPFVVFYSNQAVPNPTKPTTSTFSSTSTLYSVLNSVSAYVGISAATGGYNQQQMINSWIFCRNGEKLNSTDLSCIAPTPTPTPTPTATATATSTATATPTSTPSTPTSNFVSVYYSNLGLADENTITAVILFIFDLSVRKRGVLIPIGNVTLFPCSTSSYYVGDLPNYSSISAGYQINIYNETDLALIDTPSCNTSSYYTGISFNSEAAFIQTFNGCGGSVLNFFSLPAGINCNIQLTTPTATTPNQVTTLAPTGSPTAATGSSTQSSLSIGAIVGIVIGVLFCLIIVIIIIIALFVVRRRQNKKQTFVADSSMIIEMSTSSAQGTMTSLHTQTRTSFGDRTAHLHHSETFAPVPARRPGDAQDELNNYIDDMKKKKQSNGENDTIMNTVNEVSLPGFLFMSMNQLQVSDVVGGGGNGLIKRATVVDPTWKKENPKFEEVAVKFVPGASSDAEQNDLNFQQEVAAMNALRFHQNVATLLGFCESPRVIILPLYQGDLHGYLHLKGSFETRPFPWTTFAMLDIATQVAAAIMSMHSLNIVHRDIKPKNVLLEAIKPSASLSGFPFRARVCDFGISRIVDNEYHHDVKGMGLVNVFGLSIQYAAPEVFSHMHLASKGSFIDPEEEKKGDIYAFAITLWECLTEKIPYKGISNDEINKMVTSGDRPELPEASDVPDGNAEGIIRNTLADIIRSCWHQMANSRLDARKLVAQLEKLQQQSKDSTL